MQAWTISVGNEMCRFVKPVESLGDLLIIFHKLAYELSVVEFKDLSDIDCAFHTSGDTMWAWDKSATEILGRMKAAEGDSECCEGEGVGESGETNSVGIDEVYDAKQTLEACVLQHGENEMMEDVMCLRDTITRQHVTNNSLRSKPAIQSVKPVQSCRHRMT